MAVEIKRDKYAVVETNHVAAVRTGNMKAQYEREMNALENGMGVTVDEAGKLVKFAAEGDILYLHASEEQIYEEHLGRNAYINEGAMLPRVLKLEIGDIFETNAIKGADIDKDVVLKPGLDGYWATDGVATNFVAKVVELVTLPNGEAGAKLVIVAPVA